MKTACRNLLLLLLTAAGLVYTQTGDDEQAKIENLSRSHRALYGAKLKLSDRFAVKFFRADYWGSGMQHKTAEDSEPYRYTGWDMVPGIEVNVGELFSGITLSVGGDIYNLLRIGQGGKEETVEYRPRFNIFLSKRLPFGALVQWGQRFERRAWSQHVVTDGKRSLKKWGLIYRYRSSLKVASPSFTSLKISPYVFSEAFNDQENEFFSETEPGINFKPFSSFFKQYRGSLSISLADNIQLLYLKERTVVNHMLCLYAFFTFDLSFDSDN